MLPKTILTFLIANRGQVKKVFNKRSRRKLFKTIALVAVPVTGLYIFAPNTFGSVVNFGQENIGHVLGIATSVDPKIDENKFNNPKDINTKVLIGNIQWNILEAVIPDNNAFAKVNPDYCIPQSDNKFIKVKYSITNLDRELLTIPKYTLSIYDSTKTEFPFSQKTFLCILQTSNAFERYTPNLLKRGESKTFEILFEVPKDKHDFKMKIGDLSVISNDFEYVKLGL